MDVVFKQRHGQQKFVYKRADGMGSVPCMLVPAAQASLPQARIRAYGAYYGQSRSRRYRQWEARPPHRPCAYFGKYAAFRRWP